MTLNLRKNGCLAGNIPCQKILPALGYNSFMTSNETSDYRSSTGRTYQYDLSDPRQRALYGADPAGSMEVGS